MGLTEHTSRVDLPWHTALAAAALLAGAWSVPAFAATDSVVDCAQISGELSGIDRQPGALSVNVVDHIPVVGNSESGSDEIAISPENAETPTPVLYLTPRVASILRDVFGSEVDGIESDSQANQSATAVEDELQTAPVAPIADSADSAESIESEDGAPPATMIEQSEDIRRFQKQMYRTDI